MCFTYLVKQVIQWGCVGVGVACCMVPSTTLSLYPHTLKREYLSSPQNIGLILSASCNSPTPFINE